MESVVSGTHEIQECQLSAENLVNMTLPLSGSLYTNLRSKGKIILMNTIP